MDENEKKRGPGWRRVGAWIWSVLNILLGLGGIANGDVVAGVLFLLSGLCAFPPVDEYRARLVPPKLSPWISAILWIIGAMVLGPSTSETAQAPATSPSAPASPSPSPTMASAQEGRDAFRAVYGSMLAAASECDARNRTTIESMQAGDLYGSYTAATEAERTCRDVARRISNIRVPDSIPAAQREKTREALNRCSDAYHSRVAALNQTRTVLDGDARPSQVQEILDRQSETQTGIIECVVKFVTISGELGVDLNQNGSAG